MRIIGRFLIWMEERFGHFLLPVEFEQQENTPRRGHTVKLQTPERPDKTLNRLPKHPSFQL